MPNDLEEKLSLTFAIQQKAMAKQVRGNGEGMKVFLTTHSVLSCANGEKRCHTLEKIRCCLGTLPVALVQRVVDRVRAGSLRVAAAWNGEGDRTGGAGEVGAEAGTAAALSA